MRLNLFITIGFCLLVAIRTYAILYESKKIYFDDGFWDDLSKDNESKATTGFGSNYDAISSSNTAFGDESSERTWHPVKREVFEFDELGMRIYNVGVLMASHLSKNIKRLFIKVLRINIVVKDSPFDLERCGPAVDIALGIINEEFLKPHNVTLRKVQRRYVVFSKYFRQKMEFNNENYKYTVYGERTK